MYANSPTYRQRSVHSLKNGNEVMQKELLQQQLSALSAVELRKVHGCLSQRVLQDLPPIPPHWLRSSEASHTAKIMVRCYQVEGAMKILTEILRLMKPGSSKCRFYTVAPPIIKQAPKADFDPNFVKTHRQKLISSMQHPIDVLNILKRCQILNAANKEAISIFAGIENKNRALVDLVLTMGEEAQKMFCQALSQSEPFLFDDLDHQPISGKKSPLAEMIEFLVSDEFRAFHWLISCDMSEDYHQLQQADRQTMQNILEKRLGPERAADLAQSILKKIVPLQSLGIESPSLPLDTRTQSREEMNADATVLEITPDVHEDGTLFRLRHPQAAVIRCTETNMIFEGGGDVIYQMVPWDMDFLSSKGLRPAGPLFRFTLLAGHFHHLHLPHCQMTPGADHCSLSVAHVTEDRVNFIHPVNVTDRHVVVGISSFSCLGLVTGQCCDAPIRGLVLLFSELSDNPEVDSSVFVLLQPNNVPISQVRNEWRKRNKAEYVESPCECELIPHQTYTLSGEPVKLIQPEHSKFLNFSDYNNFFPSFEVHVATDVNKVELQLTTKSPAHSLIDWFFHSRETEVWKHCIKIQRKGVPSVSATEMLEVKYLLFKTLENLQSDGLEEFQNFLCLHDDPIPRCHLEAADRMKTVELMVQKYLPNGARGITAEILRRMNMNHLALDL